MENNNEFNKPNPEETPITTPPTSSFPNKEIEEPKKSMGAVIGSIIVIIIIIMGGLYFWGQKLTKEENLLNTTVEDIQNQPDEALDTLKTQGDSDELADIEKDLEATDLDDLEKDLENIDLELNL